MSLLKILEVRAIRRFKLNQIIWLGTPLLEMAPEEWLLSLAIDESRLLVTQLRQICNYFGMMRHH